MAESLKNKTVKGVGWSAADAFLGHGVTFIVGLVLARLLSPSEYGLIGICTIFTTVLSGIVDSGFSNALIRKKDATEEDYSTMFVTNMAISLILYILLYLCSPLIAAFFERPELVSLVRAVGLVLIFQALSLVQYTRLTKRIDFKTKTKASFIAAVVSGILGIVFAFLGFGVWALVIQVLSNKLIYTICLWILNKWSPSLSVSKDSFYYMWGYGWKLMLSGLLDNVWKELYQTVVGKCYSPATLGQYTRAKEYGQLFSSNFTRIVQRVTFPALALVQDNRDRLVSAYRRIIRTSMFITAVCMIFMGAISEPLIYCLIGPKWHQAATFLPIICLSLSLYPLHAINLNMLQVQGRSDIFLYLEIIKKIISIGPLCLGIFVGIYWMLVGSLVTGIIAFFLNTYYTGKKLKYTSWMQLKDVAPFYGISIIVAVSVYFLKYLPMSYWLVLPVQIITGAGILFLICETTKLSEYYELKNIVRDYITKLKHKKESLNKYGT